MHRDSEHASLEIPQRDVDDADQPDRELFGAIELPEAVPEPLSPLGPLADELFAEDAVDDVREHRATPLVVCLADRTLLGRDAKNGGGAGAGRAAKPATPRKGRSHRRKRDQIDVNCRDQHRTYDDDTNDEWLSSGVDT